MQPRVPSHPMRRSRRVAFGLTMTILVLALPAASFAQTPVVDSLVIAPGVGSAAASANVVSDGGSPITQRGFIYSITANTNDPTFAASYDGYVTATGTLGAMSETLTLAPNQTYSLKGYAYNGTEYGYSTVETFTTLCPARFFPNLPSGAVGTNYPNSSVLASGGYGNDVYFDDGGLPPGLSLEPNSGYIYGSPTTPGIFNFTISVLDQAYGCTGARSYSLAIEALDVYPRKFIFASEVVGVPSPPKAITVTNNGPGDVNLTLPFSISAPFTVDSTDCGAVLSSGTLCNINVAYTPPAATAHTGTLGVTHDQPGSPIVVSLKGAGTVTAVSQVYASNYFGDSVYVIDPVTNAVRNVIDPLTNAVRTSIAVGGAPGGLRALPGGGKVYVPNETTHTVSVISTSTNAVIGTISDGTFNGPIAVAPTPLGDQVWVLNRWSNGANSISIIDTATDSVVGVVNSGCVAFNSGGLVANPVNHEMYVFSRNTGEVCVIDRVTRAFTRSIYIGGSPTFGLVMPNGSALYVNRGNNGMAKIALPASTVTYIAGVYGMNMDMKADGSKIYLGRQNGEVGVLTTSTDAYAPIALTGGNATFGVAVHDSGGRVYVTDDGANIVHLVDLATGLEVTNADIPIKDPGFSGIRSITSIKAAVPGGVPPTVGGLNNGPPGWVATQVGANVTANGGLPIFERGFAYSTIDTTPEPGELDVLIAPVAGQVGPMSTTLTALTSGATYYYQAYAKNLAGTGFSGVGSFLNQTCPAVQIDTTSIPTGFAGAPYTATIAASGGTGPYTFSYLGLPAELTGTGNTISGTPTATRATIEVTATDNPTGCFATATFPLLIGSSISAGDLVISEFRTRGVGGAADEYIELGNRTGSKIVVLAQDGSGGWSVANSAGTLATIPDGTVIEKGGHWLAAGIDFSLWDYGSPSPLCRVPDFGFSPPRCFDGADGFLAGDLADDLGIAVFKTASSGAYAAATRLDSAGGTLETNPLFFEGAPLAELGSTNPTYQTAWVRRITNAAVLSDVDDNDRDFTFVATDGGFYGPTSQVAGVLGAPNPEDTFSVRDVLNAEFPASLVDPNRGPQQSPNRQVSWRRLEYRRVFTNNTGADIGTLAFKVINLTTLNSRQTLAVQGDLRARNASSASVYLPDTAEWVYPVGSYLDRPSMYPLIDFNWGDSQVGGINSRLIVPLGFGGGGIRADTKEAQAAPCGVLGDGESLPVNFRLHIASGGYYLFVLLPQIGPAGGKVQAKLPGGQSSALCAPSVRARER